MKHIWSLNTKDTFGGAFSPSGRTCSPGVLGHPRSSPINNPIFRLASAFGAIIKVFLVHLLFRRVRPVESRIYAFTRNSFAVIAMAILLFRTITALLQAQNEIGTRVTSANCEGRASSSYNIGILMERITYDPSWNSSLSKDVLPPDNIDIVVSASWRHPRRGQEPFGSRNCTIQWSEKSATFRGYFGTGPTYQNRTVEFYGCPAHWTNRFRNYPQLLKLSANSDIFGEYNTNYTIASLLTLFITVYQVEIRPQTPGGKLLHSQMPYIWLLNSNEIPSNFSTVNIDSFQVRDYMPPWELLPGSHIEAEAKLITRRFISSSIMKDVVLNSEPAYKPLSLYPIVESSVTPLNSSDAAGATATIHASLTPGLTYLRNQIDVQNPTSANICDFIDDYRSGSVLDVIGSVGGLFALLQAIHLLLFGRPLFWGLTGSKLITPFGLLGKCGSRGFKRRLKDEYHRKSVEDGSEMIRIVKFLRDFVIEFGPADLDPEDSSLRQPNASLSSLEEVTDTQTPLMQLSSETTLAQKEGDINRDMK